MDAGPEGRCSMSFTMKIECDNAAFEDEVALEVARILEAAGKALRMGNTSGRCIDANGNRVGTWELAEGGDE